MEEEVLTPKCKVDNLRDLIDALIVMFSHLVFFLYDHNDYFNLVTRYDMRAIIHYTQTEHDIGYRNKTRPVPVVTRRHRGRQTKVRKIS